VDPALDVSIGDDMERFRPQVLVLVVVAVVVLAVVLSHGLRVRLEWGSSGFVLGLICGVLLTVEIRHRRKQKESQKP
jgi:hypothetical protein